MARREDKGEEKMIVCAYCGDRLKGRKEWIEHIPCKETVRVELGKVLMTNIEVAD